MDGLFADPSVLSKLSDARLDDTRSIAPWHLFSTVLVLLLPLLYIHADYRAFVSLGPGGTSPFFSYLSHVFRSMRPANSLSTR